MNIICAYCKVTGHHIKFCAELAAKNNRTKKTQLVKPPIDARSKAVQPSKEINRFEGLYSSDDEEEEGEIVEDRTAFRKRALEDVLEKEEDMPSKWLRSGIKSIVIKMPQTEHVQHNPYNVVASMEGSHMDYYYYNKYRGMTWAEIEYASDSE